MAWLITIISCGFFIISFSKKIENTEYKNILAILVFQLIMIAPLFILGWDFGRWIFLWTVSAIILFTSGFKVSNYFDSLIVTDIKKWRKSTIYVYISKNHWLLFIFGIPGCCWSIRQFIESSPVGYYLKHVLVFLKNIT